MASKTPEINVVDEHFAELVTSYQSLKTMKDDIDKKLTETLEAIEDYTGADKSEPFEGRVKLNSGNLSVTLEYKMNYKVSNEDAKRICRETGLDPEHIFNVKYEFSKTKYVNVTAEELNVINQTVTQSRGKSSITIKENK